MSKFLLGTLISDLETERLTPEVEADGTLLRFSSRTRRSREVDRFELYIKGQRREKNFD